jgi:hypothetical protein
VSIVASKKAICDGVRRGVAGKTRDEIMEAIYAEFDLPRPKARPERPDPTAESISKPTSPKASRKVKS